MARSVKEQTGVDPANTEPVLEIPEPEPSATEEDARPEWLDSKFESVEAQAKAYHDAQRAMSQSVERQRQTEQRLEELAAQINAQPEPQPQQQGFGQDALMQHYQEALENGDAFSLMGINAYLAQQSAEQVFKDRLAEFEQRLPQQNDDQNAQLFAVLVEQQAAARYGDDWDNLKLEVGEELARRPYLLPDNGDLGETVDALSLVADAVRARRGATAQSAAQDAGRQAKLMAQGVSGSAGRPDTQQVNPGDYLQQLMKQVR